MHHSTFPEAIAKIHLPYNNFQTGFLFTDYGHILTAAHGIKLSLKYINIAFEDDPDKIYRTKILEYEYNINNCLDFCILKVVDASFYENKRHKLIIGKYDPSKLNSKDISIFGYLKEINKYNATHLSGKILGFHPVLSKIQKTSWLHLKVNTQFFTGGVSGAPILLNGVAIGMQSSQMILPTKNKSVNIGATDFYASSIQFIKSNVVREELNGNNRPIFTKPNYFQLFKTSESHCVNRFENRNALLVSDFLNQEESKLFHDFKNQTPYKLFTDGYARLLKILKTFSGNELPLIDLKIMPVSKNEHATTDLFKITERLNDQIGGFRKLLRCVIDTGSHYTHNIKSNSHIDDTSHLVHIKLLKSKLDSIQVGSDDHVHCCFEITYTNSDKVLELLKTIVLGILLDITYFNSIPILPHLINDIDSKRSFSLRKVQFAHSLGLKLFNKINIEPNWHYLSFGWLCVNTKKPEIFAYEYSQLWKKFLSGTHGLFSEIYQGYFPLDKSDNKSIIENIIKIPKYGKQISKTKLQQSILKLSTDSKGKLYAIVFLIRKPKSSIERQRLKPFFATLRLKSFAIIQGDEFKKTMKLTHLLDFYYFIK